MNLSVSEIFTSLQGEGKYTGIPTTFVRLYGCNLRCSYCDASYTRDGRRKKMAIPTILQRIFQFKNMHVCITGGEPFTQDSTYVLLYDLLSRGYIVTVETNGAIAIPEVDYKRSYTLCMDVKCPSSGMERHNVVGNLESLQAHDEVKFVIKDYEDFLYAKAFIRKYPTKAQIIMSPMFSDDDKHNGGELAQWLIEHGIPNCRLGLQSHKFLGID